MQSKEILKKEVFSLITDIDQCFDCINKNEEKFHTIFSYLESRTKNMCEAVLSLPENERKNFVPVITDLLNKSQSLKDLLMQEKIKVEKEIERVNKIGKCIKVYKKYSVEKSPHE